MKNQRGIIIETFTILVLLTGLLISGVVEIKVHKEEKKVEIIAHPEKLKEGVPDYTVNK